MKMKKGGFSLIELVTVIAVLALITGVLIAMFLAGSDMFSSEKDILYVTLDGTKAMETMTSEIRNSRQVIAANPFVFTFWKQDSDSDGTRDEAETVSYLWDGDIPGKLYRECLGAGQVIINNVNSLYFTYDSGTLSQITKVDIRLSVSSGTQIQTFESSVRMRNI
jgi:hypothetical protein